MYFDSGRIIGISKQEPPLMENEKNFQFKQIVMNGKS